MIGGLRNYGPTPVLDEEGSFERPLPAPLNPAGSPDWHAELTPFERLHCHHTLASARRFVHFKPLDGLSPKDALDITLEADYNQSTGKFADQIDVILQKVTFGEDNRRRLRNILDVPKPFDPIGNANRLADQEAAANCRFGPYNTAGHRSPMSKWKYPVDQYGRYDDFHELYVTGLKERRNRNCVKLMHSSHHSPQTNAGYSRQDSDGNAYQY